MCSLLLVWLAEGYDTSKIVTTGCPLFSVVIFAVMVVCIDYLDVMVVIVVCSQSCNDAQ